MQIRKSLLLLVVFLGLALLVNLLALAFLAQTMTGSLPAIAADTDQQVLAVQMQARLRDSEAALYRYLMEGNPGFKGQYRDQLQKFRADVTTYEASVITEQEQDWADGLNITHQQADSIGANLIRLRDGQDLTLEHIEDIEIALSTFLAHQVRVARPDDDSLYQNAVSGTLY